MRAFIAAGGLACLVVSGTVGCGGQQHRPMQIVSLFDASASITDDTRAALIASVTDAASTVNRGDELIVVPITGAALTDTPERVLRFSLSLKREPYDADRRRFAEDAKAALEKLLAEIDRSPFGRTDLLGAFDFALEEFSTDPTVNRKLVCLSDFIQDDKQFDFKTSPRVASESAAVQTAQRLAVGVGRPFHGVTVLLGSVQSLDLRGLSRERQEAIRAFWITLLEAKGAAVSWKTDGLGHVAAFLARPGSTSSAPALPAAPAPAR